METKSSVSTFPLVKDYLVKGMVNACRLRAESDAATDEPFYRRNPYTNVDILAGRLIGKETISYNCTFTYKEHGCNWSVKLGDGVLTVRNNKESHEHFGKGVFVIYDWETKSEQELNDSSFAS